MIKMNFNFHIRSVILVMSLMGSSVLILYFLFKPILRNFFDTRIKIIFLMISATFFLVPFPELKYQYIDLLNFFNFKDTANILSNKLGEFKSYIYFLPDELVSPNAYNITVLITTIWLVLALIRFLCRIRNYKKFKQNIIESSYSYENDYVQNLVRKYKQELNIKRKVSVLYSDFSEPVSTGFINPIILIPKDFKVKQNNLEYIIKHELTHIYHKDSIFKTIVLIVYIVHWFNPMAHLLKDEMEQLLECYCDETVVKDLNKEERNLYSQLIIDISTENINCSKTDDPNMGYFGSNAVKKIKRRLIEMKRIKKPNKLNFVLSLLMLSVITISNSMLVFAYKEYPTSNSKVHSNNEELTEYLNNRENHFITYKQEKPDIISDENGVQTYFVNENHQIVMITENAESPNVWCNHTYDWCYRVSHKKNADGSCTEEYYKCKYCTKCAHIEEEIFDHTSIYPVCPHSF